VTFLHVRFSKMIIKVIIASLQIIFFFKEVICQSRENINLHVTKSVVCMQFQQIPCLKKVQGAIESIPYLYSLSLLQIIPSLKRAA